MTQAAIAGQIHQTLDVHCNFTPQIAFNRVIGINRFTNVQNFLIGKVLNPTGRINLQFFNNVSRSSASDTVNVGKRNDYALVSGDIYPSNTCQYFSPCSTGTDSPGPIS